MSTTSMIEFLQNETRNSKNFVGASATLGNEIEELVKAQTSYLDELTELTKDFEKFEVKKQTKGASPQLTLRQKFKTLAHQT